MVPLIGVASTSNENIYTLPVEADSNDENPLSPSQVPPTGSLTPATVVNTHPSGSNESLSNNSASTDRSRQEAEVTPKKLQPEIKINGCATPTTPSVPAKTPTRKRKTPATEGKTKQARIDRKMTDYFKSEKVSDF